MKQHLDTNLIRVSLIIAMIYCVLFNTPIFIYNYQHYQIPFFKRIFDFGQDFLAIYIYLFILFFGLTIHRLLFIICTIILFITGAIASYHVFFFNSFPKTEKVAVFFNTNPTDLPELISIKLFIWIVFSVFAATYTIKYFKVQNTSLFFSKILSGLCLLVALNFMISPTYTAFQTHFPVQYLNSTYKYFVRKTSLKTSGNSNHHADVISGSYNG